MTVVPDPEAPRPREMQERIGRIEQVSALIRGFQPAMVIGLVQTLDYARA
jgi:hypothetical protein